MGKVVSIHAAKKSEVHERLTEIHSRIMTNAIEKKRKIKKVKIKTA